MYEFEHSRLEELKEKRRRREELIGTSGSFLCDQCPRDCGSAIRLSSHLRAHERTAARTTGNTA